jgi:nucleoside-diphosphate-sugar epimerase
MRALVLGGYGPIGGYVVARLAAEGHEAIGAAIALTGAYLVAATLWRPDLWFDPLGPLAKDIPVVVLPAMLDER